MGVSSPSYFINHIINQERWKLHLFSRESGGDNKYECLGGVGFSQCIPYEGNEHLLGTNKNK